MDSGNGGGVIWGKKAKLLIEADGQQFWSTVQDCGNWKQEIAKHYERRQNGFRIGEKSKLQGIHEPIGKRMEHYTVEET